MGTSGSGGSGQDPTLLFAVPAASAGTYSYVLRLGATDTAVEDKLTANDAGLTDKTTGWPGSGALLYAWDNVTLVSPAINEVTQTKGAWSSDTLTVTTGWDGRIQTAQRSYGTGTTSYTAADIVSVQNAASTTLANGLTTAVTTGMNASLTTGVELYAVTGIVTDVTWGLGIEIDNGDLQISTPSGSYGLGSDETKVSGGDIVLGAGSVAAGRVQTSGETLVKAMEVALAAAGIAAAANDVIIGGVFASETDIGGQKDQISQSLESQMIIAQVLAGVLALVELGTVVLAGMVISATQTPANTTLTLSEASASLSVGPFGNIGITTATAAEAYAVQAAAAAAALTEATTALTMAPLRARATGMPRPSGLQEAVDSAAKAKSTLDGLLAAGDEVATVTVNGTTVAIKGLTSLTLGVGPAAASATSIELTADGITLTAPSITLNGTSIAQITEALSVA